MVYNYIERMAMARNFHSAFIFVKIFEKDKLISLIKTNIMRLIEINANASSVRQPTIIINDDNKNLLLRIKL
jgi:hypothetical protein